MTVKHIINVSKPMCGGDPTPGDVYPSQVDRSRPDDYCRPCWEACALEELYEDDTHFAKVPTTATWCGRPEGSTPATALTTLVELVSCPECRSEAEITV